ncbi:MAG TPA: hypothetical protein VF756_22365 [Thermoanaerobaculia bacterium]
MRKVPLIVFAMALCIVALYTRPATAGWVCGNLQRSPVETGMGTSCTAAQSNLINKLYSHVKCFNTCYERIVITQPCYADPYCDYAIQGYLEWKCSYCSPGSTCPV